MAEPRMRLVGSWDSVTQNTEEKTSREDVRTESSESHELLSPNSVYGGLARRLELLCLRLQRQARDDRGFQAFALPVRAAMVELEIQDQKGARMAVWRILNRRFVEDGFLAVVHRGKPGSGPDANLYRVVRR